MQAAESRPQDAPTAGPDDYRPRSAERHRSRRRSGHRRFSDEAHQSDRIDPPRARTDRKPKARQPGRADAELHGCRRSRGFVTIPTPRIVLKARRALPFFDRHPWVYAGAIADAAGDPADGAVVELVSSA